MAIEKKSLIDARSAAKKAVVASKTAAPTPGHTVVAPKGIGIRPLKAMRMHPLKAARINLMRKSK